MNAKDPLLAVMLAAAEEMDGNELEAVIGALAEVRQRKLPAVPGTRQALKASGPMVSLSVEREPAIECTQQADGSVMLWARSSGFGWIAFGLSDLNAKALAAWFAGNLQAGSDLFSEGITQSH